MAIGKSTSYVPRADVTIIRAARVYKSFSATADTAAARGTALVAAFAALAAGDELKIGPGEFTISATLSVPSRCVIRGSGYETCIKLADGLNSTINMITNSDTTNGNTAIVISSLRLDGNNTNNTSGTQSGIFLVKCTKSIIENNWIEHFGRAATTSCIGIKPDGCSDCQIIGNNISDVVDGINPTNSTSGQSNSRLVISGNSVTSTSRDYAINLFATDDSVIVGNTLVSNKSNINMGSSNRNIISSNICNGSTVESGIFIQASANDNLIIGNAVRNANLYGVRFHSSTGTGNKILFNDLVGSGSSGDISFALAATTAICHGNLTTTATASRSLSALGSTRLLGKLVSANFNSTSDQSIIIGSANYIIDSIVVTNASVSLTTAAGGIYTAASKGGTALVAAGQVYTSLSSASKFLTTTLDASAASTAWTGTTIYLSLTTGQGSAATADVLIYGRDLNGG